jgi:hypothetical protein
MKKWANESNRTFSKEEVQMAKKTHEERLNILGHKGNANQNYIKILSHSSQNGYNQEYRQQQMLAKMWGKRNPHTLLVGM